MLMDISIIMSVVIAFLIVLNPVITRRYGAKWGHYLWLMIAIRLALPFRFSISLPQMNNEAVTTVGNVLVLPVIKMTQITTNLAMPEAGMITGSSDVNTLPYWVVFRVIWIIGFIVFTMYNTLGYIHFMRRIKESANLIIEPVQLKELKTELNIKKEIPIKICNIVHSPMLYGLLKPTILLPQMPIDDKSLYFVLKHELNHYKQGHIWYKFLGVFVSTVHWFNPFVYLLRRQMDISCEMACDERVVNELDTDQRLQYIQIIMHLIRQQSMDCMTPLSTYLNSNKKTMKRRFLTIMDTTRKKKGLVIVITACLIIALTGVFIVNNTGNHSIQTSQQSNIMESLLETYYNTNSHDILDELMTETDFSGLDSLLDSLYQEKYKDLLSEDAYGILVSNRAILDSEQIVKDFDCTLELISTEFIKEGETFEKYPSYSYKAYVKITLSNLESKEVVETGSINFSKEEDKWIISLLKIEIGALYNQANELSSGS